MKRIALSLTFLAGFSLNWTAPIWATPRPQSATPRQAYRIAAVSRSIPVLRFPARDMTAEVYLAGTGLMPKAQGEAKVYRGEADGMLELEARVSGLLPAWRFSADYLTYVFWAIAPDGTSHNLGEVTLQGNTGRLSAKTDLSAFSIIITAEPHFAVTRPSGVVVVQNAVHWDADPTVSPTGAVRAPLDPKIPMEIYQARNAVRMARRAGAEQYSTALFHESVELLAQAENGFRENSDRAAAAAAARDAIVKAESARAETLAYFEEERRENERLAELEREAAQRQAEEQARLEQDRQEAAAAEEAERLRREAEQQVAQLRAQLVEQFKTTLETQETEGGLVVNMSDVLFDAGEATLSPAAREKLAKISGIVLAHPGLTIRIEGHTDNIGSEEANRKLSEDRAAAVRDYLVSQGVPAEAVTTRGLGATAPIAPNDTPDGRQRNRRVEMIVSGGLLGL